MAMGMGIRRGLGELGLLFVVLRREERRVYRGIAADAGHHVRGAIHGLRYLGSREALLRERLRDTLSHNVRDRVRECLRGNQIC